MADDVIESNNNDGVAKVIKNILKFSNLKEKKCYYICRRLNLEKK